MSFIISGINIASYFDWNAWFGISLPKYAILIINVILFFVALKIIYWFLKKGILFLTRKTETEFDDEIIKAIEQPLLYSILVLFFASQVQFLTTIEWIVKITNLIAGAIIIWMITWFLYRFIGILYEHVLKPIAEKTESNLDDQLYPLLRKILRVVLIVLAIIYTLNWFGINITPLLAGIGIGGLALAFAAQRVLADVFGGVAILADKPFELDDKIRIDTNTGYVKEVGLRTTRIKTLDGNTLIIPNNKAADSIVENINTNADHKVKIKLTLVHSTPSKDVERAKTVIKEVLDSNKSVKKEFTIVFSDFVDAGLLLEINYSINNKDNMAVVKDAVNMELKKRFDKEGIKLTS